MSISIAIDGVGTAPIGEAFIPAEVVQRLLDLEREVTNSRISLRAAEKKLGRESDRFKVLLARHNAIFTEIGRLKTDIRFGEEDVGVLGQRVGALADTVKGFVAEITALVGAPAEGIASGLATIGKYAAIGAVAILGVVLAPAILGAIRRGRTAAASVNGLGLGYSDDEHRAVASRAVENARALYYEANRAIRGRDCDLGLQKLLEATFLAGGAEANAVAASDFKAVDRVRRLEDSAKETLRMLRSSCLGV